MSDAAARPAHRRAAVAFVFVTVMLDMLALGIIVPVFPKLVEGFVGGDAAKGATVFGLFGTVWNLMQFLFSPVLGALSDRFGRRRVILLSNLGLGLDYVLMALSPNLAWLFVGRVVSGITAASYTTASAYIADVTPPERRAAGFGILGAAFGLGFILGPAAGGLLGTVDPRLPFWGAAALSLANAGYGFFVLPELLPPERRSGFTWRKASPLGALALLRSQPELLGLAGVYFLFQLAYQVLPSTFVLYTTDRYAWDQAAVGLTLALIGVASTVVQGGLVRPIVAWLGERRALLLGLAAGTAGNATFGLASTGHAFWLGIPLMAFVGLFNPGAQGLMTRRVSPSEQGRLQGALSGLQGMTGLIGPTLFTLTFATFISSWRDLHLPGAPFLLAALLLTAATALAARVTRPALPVAATSAEASP